MERNIVVNESSQTLRALGRRALIGNWGLAIGGFTLYALLLVGPVYFINKMFGYSGAVLNIDTVVNRDMDYSTMIMNNFSDSFVSNIYSLLVTGPLSLGLIIFIGSIFRRKNANISEIFNGFEQFIKAFTTYFVMSFFIFLWSLLFIIPGIIATYRYAMTFYILMDNPDMKVMEVINASKEMMRNNKWKLFCLQLSFIGWGILTLFTLGLGMIVLGPYMETSMFAFYEIANGNLRIDYSYGSPVANEESGLSKKLYNPTEYKEIEGPEPDKKSNNIKDSQGQ